MLLGIYVQSHNTVIIFFPAHFYRKFTENVHFAMHNTHSHTTCKGMTMAWMPRMAHPAAVVGNFPGNAEMEPSQGLSGHWGGFWCWVKERQRRSAALLRPFVPCGLFSVLKKTSPWAIISADVSTRAPEEAVNDLNTQGSAPMLPGVTVVLEILQNRESLSIFS